MDYALDFAVRKDIIGRQWDNNVPEKEFRIVYTKGDPQKSELVRMDWIRQLKAGDQVFLEAGSGADCFALGCLRQGAKVWRLPTHLSKAKREQSGKGKEATAEILQELSTTSPDLFYSFGERQAPVAEIAALATGYRRMQDDVRKPLVQKTRASVQEIALAQGAPDAIEVSRMTEAMVNEIFEPSFLQTLAKTKPNFSLADVLEGALKAIEKGFYTELQHKLKRLPLFQAIFDPIPGCGPRIAGSVIGQIGDIRAFRSPGALKSYAGYGQSSDNPALRQRRRTGELFPVNQELKQATWDFSQQTRMYGRADNPWRIEFDKRTQYELDKFGNILILVAIEVEGDTDDLLNEACKVLNALDVYEKGNGEVATFINNLRGQNLKDLATMVSCLDAGQVVTVKPQVELKLTEKLGFRAKDRAARYIGQQFMEHVWTEWTRWEKCQQTQSAYVYQKPSWA